MGMPARLGVSAAGLPNLGDQANAVLSGTITAVGPTPAFAFRGPMNLALWDSTITTLTTTLGSLAASVASATGIANGTAIASVNLPSGSTVSSLVGSNFTLALAPRTHRGTITQPAVSPALITLNPGEPTDRLLGATVTVPSTAEGCTLPANTTVTAIITPAVVSNNNAPGTPGVIQLSAAPTVSPQTNAPIPFQFALDGAAILVSGTDAAASFTDAAMKWDATVQLERSFDGGFTWAVCNIGGAGALAQYLDLSSVQLTFGEPEKNVLYRLNCIEYTAGTINYRISQTGGAAESLAIGPLSGG